MPQLNITLSGETNSSVSGHVTDPTVLRQLEAVMRHVQDRAKVDPPEAEPPAEGGTAPAS